MNGKATLPQLTRDEILEAVKVMKIGLEMIRLSGAQGISATYWKDGVLWAEKKVSDLLSRAKGE